MLLDSYRILDFANHRGQLCGKILADMGGDVVKIEPPGGDPVRRKGPFLHDDPHPEKSLYWFAHNTNKRSVTLDIAKEDGKRLLLEMVKNAKFLIESFSPDYLEDLGLSYASLSVVNPSLVMVSITPFGRTGPYRHFKDSDSINMGMGGQMVLCGDPDRPPLCFTVEQSYCLAGMYAALAALAAHVYRERTGKGQHIDVSIQESVVLTTFNLHPFWELQGISLRREGPRSMRGELTFRSCWKCRDGYISWRLFTGSWGRWTRALVDLMKEEGEAGDLANVPWEEIDMNMMSQEQINRFEAAFGDFFLQHTKRELFERALRGELPLFPVNTTVDLLEDEQLAARGFWREVEYAELGLSIRHPGPAFQTSGEACSLRRAPRIGEHNKEIYRHELGLSSEALIILKGAGVI